MVKNVRLDDDTYVRIKGRAALEGRPIGRVLSEAVTAYLKSPLPKVKRRSLKNLQPERFPNGNERLSEEIDQILYGA